MLFIFLLLYPIDNYQNYNYFPIGGNTQVLRHGISIDPHGIIPHSPKSRGTAFFHRGSDSAHSTSTPLSGSNGTNSIMTANVSEGSLTSYELSLERNRSTSFSATYSPVASPHADDGMFPEIPPRPSSQSNTQTETTQLSNAEFLPTLNKPQPTGEPSLSSSQRDASSPSSSVSDEEGFSSSQESASSSVLEYPHLPQTLSQIKEKNAQVQQEIEEAKKREQVLLKSLQDNIRGICEKRIAQSQKNIAALQQKSLLFEGQPTEVIDLLKEEEKKLKIATHNMQCTIEAGHLEQEFFVLILTRFISDKEVELPLDIDLFT